MNSRDKGRGRLFRLREETELASEEMQAESAIIEAIKGAGPARSVSAFNLFQTPPEIVELMTGRLASLLTGTPARVLEPSAGLGRLYHGIRKLYPSAHATLVEIETQCAAELYRQTESDRNSSLIQDDFLRCTAERLGGNFDAVLMNPPFKQGRDLKHIRHAFDLLKPGGVLVSLCYAGVRQSEALRDSPEWNWCDLPSGSFKSEGTGAAVAMVWRVRND